MAHMIQVRNVPDDVHRILKTRAAAAGMTLSDYIKRDLVATAAQPSPQEIDRRVIARGSSELRTEAIVESLRSLRRD